MSQTQPFHWGQGGAHMDIAPGELAPVNGGALIVSAAELEQGPEILTALKAALRSRRIGLSHPSLSPASIPLDIAVVVVGDAQALQRLESKDTSFASFFPVRVQVSERLERTRGNERAFAGWIAGLVARDGRLPLSAAAVSALSRRAGDRFLPVNEDDICGILTEAHLGALLAEDKVIDAGHIQHVLVERAKRAPERTGTRAGT